MKSQSRRKGALHLLCWYCLVAVYFPTFGEASKVDNLLSAFARSKVLKSADEVADAGQHVPSKQLLPQGKQAPVGSSSGQELGESLFSRNPADVLSNMKPVDGAEFLRRSKVLGLAPEMVYDLRRLPSADQARFLKLAEDMKPILENPTMGLRTVRLLDLDGLIMYKHYGDEIAEVTTKLGDRRFLDVVRKMDRSAVDFYREWVKPHWGKWVASGLFASYLAAPERFHDMGNKLTEHATEQLTKLGIILLTAPVEGIRKALKNTWSEDKLPKFCKK